MKALEKTMRSNKNCPEVIFKMLEQKKNIIEQIRKGKSISKIKDIKFAKPL